ncbi:MAG: carboxypeptidase regulatory-like domain-containing protein [Anaerolineae bacterium]|nr:carboxypeptidase regulatory-like domain-containing protein [Anaerolineae bacterium]
MRRIPSYLVVMICGLFFVSAGLAIIAADGEENLAPPADSVPLQVEPTVTPEVSLVEPVIPAAESQPVQEQPVIVEPSPIIVEPVIPTSVPVNESQQEQAVVPEQSPPITIDTSLTPEFVLEQPVVVPTAVSDAPSTVEVLGTLPPPSDGVPQSIEPLVPTTASVSSSTDVMQPILAHITGQVLAPLRADSSGIVIMLTLPDGTALQTTTDSSGSFSFPNLQPGTYRVDAGTAGFLTAQATLNLSEGQVLTLSPATLVAGDTNFDNIIDLTDAALIAANFDTQSNLAGADLNRDGVIDILDLTAIGAFFGLSGPVNWQSS